MNQRIAVVIVNFNAGDHLLTTLRSVYESQQRVEHVIVVDNASTDGSLEKCRDAYPKITYIKNSHNLGFAAGANVGARYALERHATSVIFLNPDATLTTQCIGLLSKALEDASVGIAVPLIYRTQDKSIWYAGGRIDYKRQRAIHVQQMPRTNALIDTKYATGCVMAVSASTLETVGLFDEKYFLYYEDADLSLRTLSAGKRVVLVPEAVAWHIEASEGNLPQKTYFLVLSGLIFFHKHAKGWMKMWTVVFTKIRALKADIHVLIHRDKLSQVVQRAFKDYKHVKKTKHIMPYRKL